MNYGSRFVFNGRLILISHCFELKANRFAFAVENISGVQHLFRDKLKLLSKTVPLPCHISQKKK